MSKKTDGRKTNGRPNTGLTEAQVLVKGPAELLEAVEAYAVKHKISTRQAWRLAAERLTGVKS